MNKRFYEPPIFAVRSGGPGSETGEGSGQGSIAPEGMSFEEWWWDIACGDEDYVEGVTFGTNMDADYNGDNKVDKADYDYYIENELWNG